MANPQKEEGYTAIANDLFEAVYRFNFTLRELKVLLSIIRRTYGYNRKEAQLSLSFIANDTGIAKTHISTILNKLEECHIITILKRSGTIPQTISIQKNYEEWRGYQIGNGYQTGNSRVTKSVTLGVTKLVTKKDNIYKDKSKDKLYIEHLPDWFEEVWAAYPNKKGKKNISKKSYSEIEAAGKEKLLKCIENIKAFKEKNTWYSYQHGSTFFNGGWKDYVEQEEEETSKEENEEKWQ